MSEVILLKETLGNHNNHIHSYPNISPTCEEDISVLEELINEIFENSICFSPLTSPISQYITKQEDIRIGNHNNHTKQQETIEIYLHDTSTSLQ